VTVARVVSGGQTGADRAALDAALAVGMPYGGWCPAGGVAEDGPGLLDRYPSLEETPSDDPDQRTVRNVRDSDATLVLSLGPVDRSPGTARTVAEAERLGRPVLLTHPSEVEQVRSWLHALPEGCVLNVAGPRESEEPGLHDAAYALLVELLA
jgi:Circularly permutated YpsA SLOG family